MYLLNEKRNIKGDKFMALAERSYFFKRTYHYLDESKAMELVYILRSNCIETDRDISERAEPIEYDSRHIDLSSLPKDIAAIIKEKKKFREQFPLKKSEVDYLQENYSNNLFAVNKELLELLKNN